MAKEPANSEGEGCLVTSAEARALEARSEEQAEREEASEEDAVEMVLAGVPVAVVVMETGEG